MVLLYGGTQSDAIMHFPDTTGQESQTRDDGMPVVCIVELLPRDSLYRWSLLQQNFTRIRISKGIAGDTRLNRGGRSSMVMYDVWSELGGEGAFVNTLFFFRTSLLKSPHPTRRTCTLPRVCFVQSQQLQFICFIILSRSIFILMIIIFISAWYMFGLTVRGVRDVI